MLAESARWKAAFDPQHHAQQNRAQPETSIRDVALLGYDIAALVPIFLSNGCLQWNFDGAVIRRHQLA